MSIFDLCLSSNRNINQKLSGIERCPVVNTILQNLFPRWTITNWSRIDHFKSCPIFFYLAKSSLTSWVHVTQFALLHILFSFWKNPGDFDFRPLPFIKPKYQPQILWNRKVSRAKQNIAKFVSTLYDEKLVGNWPFQKLSYFFTWRSHRWRHECMSHNLHYYTSSPTCHTNGQLYPVIRPIASLWYIFCVTGLPQWGLCWALCQAPPTWLLRNIYPNCGPKNGLRCPSDT